jgi:hypothetical protein
MANTKDLLRRGIETEVNRLLSPLKRGILNGVRTAEALSGKYVWTPDQIQWGGYNGKGTSPTVAGDVYQPHFFSGQDCFFFLVNQAGQMIALPITAFGYGMSQQKIPVFGAWSYTADAFLKGTRVVQGEFSMLSTMPNSIMQLLGDPRVNDRGDQPNTPLIAVEGRDEIKRRGDLKADLWNVDGDGMRAIYSPAEVSGMKVSAYPFGREPEKGYSPADYAGHPAFDLLIVHGNDPNKISQNYENWNVHEWAHTVGDQFKLLSQDHNDISGATFSESERIYIENVELMSSGMQYDMSGQPLQESYSFIARDVTSPVPLGNGIDSTKATIPFTSDLPEAPTFNR